MDCRKARKFFESYISGDLNGPLVDRFEDHLRNCADCQRALNKEKAFILNLKKGLVLGSPQLFSSPNWDRVKTFEGKKNFRKVAPSYALLVAFCLGILLLLSPLSLDLIRGINSSNMENGSSEIVLKDAGFPNNPPSEEGLNYRIAFY